MFAPTRVWRRWFVKTSQTQRRHATASALAATALPALVLARGHRVEEIEEVPLIVSSEIESFTKTKQAVAALKALNAYEDVMKVSNSRKIRAGVGKLRNRRHVQRRGPLVIYNQDNGIVKAFRNLPGVEIASVHSLNLLQLAPGGHLGRFVIWTEDAFKQLDTIFGTYETASDVKKGYRLPSARLPCPTLRVLSTRMRSRALCAQLVPSRLSVLSRSGRTLFATAVFCSVSTLTPSLQSVARFASRLSAALAS